MKWFIPGNVPSSKNGRRWTGKYFISSKTVMKYRKATAAIYKAFASSFKKEFKTNTLFQSQFLLNLLEAAVTSLIILILHKQCKMIWLKMDG